MTDETDFGTVVGPEIRANTNLRVALRVTSPAESVDIIDAPDAARISPATPGRAYALTGHSALSMFQSARVGGSAIAAGTDRAVELATAVTGWFDAGKPPAFVTRPANAVTSGRPAVTLPSGPPASGATSDPDDTDLARLVTVLDAAATVAGVARQRRPWLPPLTETVLDLARGGLCAAATMPRCRSPWLVTAPRERPSQKPWRGWPATGRRRRPKPASFPSTVEMPSPRPVPSARSGSTLCR